MDSQNEHLSAFQVFGTQLKSFAVKMFLLDVFSLFLGQFTENNLWSALISIGINMYLFYFSNQLIKGKQRELIIIFQLIKVYTIIGLILHSLFILISAPLVFKIFQMHPIPTTLLFWAILADILSIYIIILILKLLRDHNQLVNSFKG